MTKLNLDWMRLAAAKGRLSRREFIQLAIAAGISVPVASTMYSQAVRAEPKKGGKLRMALDLTLRHALEPLRLSPFELDERHLEPGARVALGPFDPLGQCGLARPQALGDLLDGTAALGRLGF